MKNTTIKVMFEEAFGLKENEMEVGKEYYVGEANVGIKGLSDKGVSLNKVLYAVKKKKSPRVKVRIFPEGEIIVSKNHKFGVYMENLKEGEVAWIEAKNLKEDLHRLISSDLSLIDISGTEELEEDHTLDIQVEDSENYFSNGVLSHNSLYGAKEKTTGGYAIKYYSSWRARITRIDDIKEKGITVGIVSRVRNTKNKMGIPKRIAELQLYFDGGFDSDSEYLNFLVDLGIVKQGGAWYSNEEWGMKVQGKNGVEAFLKERPELFEQVKIQVNEMMAGYTALDVDEEEEEEDDDKLMDFVEEDNPSTS